MRRHRAGWIVGLCMVAMLVVGCGGEGDAGAAASGATPTERTTAEVTEPAGAETLVRGVSAAQFYTTQCAACHGANREGVVGPALTPSALSQDAAVYEDVVMNGRAGTAMAALGKNLGLSAAEVAVLVAFLQTSEP